MKNIRILFLDLDGVVNVRTKEFDKYGAIFGRHFMRNVGRIVEETGCKIVVSSSWRLSGLEYIQNMWKDRGYSGEVIDVTPSLYLKRGGCIVFHNDKLSRHPTESVGGYSIPRGCEIEYWLDHESEKFGSVDTFCILDDDRDFLLSQKDNFVCCYENFDHPDHVDFGYGLTDICTDKAIEILNNVKK